MLSDFSIGPSILTANIQVNKQIQSISHYSSLDLRYQTPVALLKKMSSQREVDKKFFLALQNTNALFSVLRHLLYLPSVRESAGLAVGTPLRSVFLR